MPERRVNSQFDDYDESMIIKHGIGRKPRRERVDAKDGGPKKLDKDGKEIKRPARPPRPPKEPEAAIIYVPGKILNIVAPPAKK